MTAPDRMAPSVGLGTVLATRFPEELIELNVEIAEGGHLDLQKKLAGAGSTDPDVLLAVIAAHCEILMDGMYTINERLHIATLCTLRLKESRSVQGPQLVPIPLQ